MSNNKNKFKNDNFDLYYALSIVFQLGFMIMASLGFPLFFGTWLDNYYNSSPIFLIIGLICGFVVAIYTTYKTLKPIIDFKNGN